MTPAIFINCSKEPFIDEIMSRLKQYETRSRNTLGRFIGKEVYLAETGSGAPLVRCSAVIDEVVKVTTREQWEAMLELTWVPVGSEYDWNDTTKVKWLYHFKDIKPLKPFRLTKGVRHGRVWMEVERSEQQC